MRWIRCRYCGVLHPEGEDCEAFRRDFADWLATIERAKDAQRRKD
jgi:hypothetical protein